MKRLGASAVYLVWSYWPDDNGDVVFHRVCRTRQRAQIVLKRLQARDAYAYQYAGIRRLPLDRSGR